ncbi:hypothetical protein [Kitasatospora sp. NPDC001175]|uniref:hypothetical protein n=1 Tax=Kitasatospora sp. NPDC001175 TaxID=3157103 RepID=UPI003CFBD87A
MHLPSRPIAARIAAPGQRVTSRTYTIFRTRSWPPAGLAVDDADAELFSELYQRYIDTDVDQPPTWTIAERAALLLERWPDLTEDERYAQNRD